MPFIVETRSLGKRYGSTPALVDCTLSIERGEVFGLLGPNGAGKSTLLRLLMGYLRPSSGRATIDSLDCYWQSPAVHARVAYLPGDVRLFRHLTGSGVVSLLCQMRGEGTGMAEQLARRLKFDLGRSVATMSTGMRQKLALAVTLAADATLLVLDEPTSNLDPTVRGEVLALVREARAAGRTVLFSSHVLSEVEQACDRVGILRGGRLVHVQTVAALRRQHRIRAKLTGPLVPAPPHLVEQLVVRASDGELTIDAPGELAPLLDWLARLPLAEVRIEPLGLQAVYEEFHAGE